MGKRIIIRDANFQANGIEISDIYDYVNNDYTWGKGGIDTPGSSSGSTNATMSMIGLPLEYTEDALTLIAANGYGIRALLTSNNASPSRPSEYSYSTYNTLLETITIPGQKYFEISISKINGDNANITEGAQSLLIRQLKEE